MYRPKNAKERIVHRVKIIQGHLEKVRGMVENDEYCIDIIHQSQAIQSALQKFDESIMENHLTECVADSIKKGDDKIAVSEVMSVFKKRKI
jgi:DNA-binding FrmR family transcriptional regulator